MSAMKSVFSGVNLVYIGLYLIVLGFVAIILGAGLAAAASPAALLFIGAGPLMLIVGTIMGLVGKIKCLSVPETVQTTGVIYTAVVCDVLVLLITVADWFVVLPTIVGTAHGCMAILAPVLFVVFLKRVAAHVKDGQSEKRAGFLLNLCIANVIVMVVGLFLPPLAIVGLILILVMFFTYVRLLLSLRVSLRVA
ncbi:MAG: hypothetical protein GY903_24570 [Fuerstiella sp.]|nr:hypothetical protein [Fuerstiella sp.]MCP4857670.1 hypothetical protein [Fuerstiella sp.]